MHLNPTTRETGKDDTDMLVKPVGGAGRGRSITEVAAGLLGYLKRDAMARIAPQFATVVPITWVLTVPAIWDEFAKSVMARAAVMAGACVCVRARVERRAAAPPRVADRARGATQNADLVPSVDSEFLVFALEPEAACIETLSGVTRTMPGAHNSIKKGSRVMIIDAGG